LHFVPEKGWLSFGLVCFSKVPFTTTCGNILFTHTFGSPGFFRVQKKLRSPDFPQKKKELRAIPVGSPFKMKGKTAFSIRLFDFCNHIEKRKCLEILVS